MKLFADYKIDGDSGYKNINIWDIYNGYNNYVSKEGKIDFKEYYNRFYKNRLFSTHKSTKMAMTLITRKPYGKSYFRYLANINSKGKFESINHSIYKEIIKELDVLNLKVDKQNIKLYVSNSDIEVGFTANGNNYYADVLINFYKSEPEVYYHKWNGKLCFEINYSHPVDDKKVNDCFLEGIAIFEHTISPKLTINEYTSSEDDLISQKNFILEKLSEVIYGKLLSDPIAYSYTGAYNLTEENKNLKIKNVELSNLNKLLLNINDKQSTEIVKLQNQNRSLKNDNVLLMSENDKQSSKIVDLQRENKMLADFNESINHKKILKFVLKIFGIKL